MSIHLCCLNKNSAHLIVYNKQKSLFPGRCWNLVSGDSSVSASKMVPCCCILWREGHFHSRGGRTEESKPLIKCPSLSTRALLSGLHHLTLLSHDNFVSECEFWVTSLGLEEPAAIYMSISEVEELSCFCTILSTDEGSYGFHVKIQDSLLNFVTSLIILICQV